MREDDGSVESLGYATRRRGMNHSFFINHPGSLLLGAVSLGCCGLFCWVPRFSSGHPASIPACKAMVCPSGAIATSLELYRQSLGSYPDKLEYLCARPPDVAADDPRWYPLLRECSFVDPWGNNLRYRLPGIGNTTGYDLVSCGPDGQNGGADDIANYRNAPQRRSR